MAIEIEQKHPEKYRRTIERIWDAGWIGCYEEYRDGYLEYVNFKDSNCLNLKKVDTFGSNTRSEK